MYWDMYYVYRLLFRLSLNYYICIFLVCFCIHLWCFVVSVFANFAKQQMSLAHAPQCALMGPSIHSLSRPVIFFCHMLPCIFMTFCISFVFSCIFKKVYSPVVSLYLLSTHWPNIFVLSWFKILISLYLYSYFLVFVFSCICNSCLPPPHSAATDRTCWSIEATCYRPADNRVQDTGYRIHDTGKAESFYFDWIICI